MNTQLREICDSANTRQIERMKTRLTMDQIDAMTEYMTQKEFPIEQCDFFDEDELSIMACIKYVSEYQIRQFITYLKKIR
jgi:hypothetical protein